MRKITKAKIVTAKPIIAYVKVEEALASFFGSPPDVTNLIPAMTISIKESAPAMLVSIKRTSEAILPKPLESPYILVPPTIIWAG